MVVSEEIPVIFDGHNDILLELQSGKRGFFERSDSGHIDLPRAQEGGLGGGFCAVYVPSVKEQARADDEDEAGVEAALAAFGDESTMPPTPEYDAALPVAVATMATLFRVERESAGKVRVVRSADEIATCLRDGVFAAILHFEGAEAIDPGLDALEVFNRSGLRSLGPVWSRPNAFGHGVPFKYPSSPDTGPGLTAAGKELIRACNRLRIMIDLSHLNEQGFWDVASKSDAPLVATHSNAHAICPAARNLTDRQLDAIKESDGMVGVNFHVGFLRADGQRDEDTPLECIVEHVRYLADRLGIDRVGLGSDFDGATMPRELKDAAGLPKLVAALQAGGFAGEDLRKVCHSNWIRVLRKTWGA
jgi:membrane dipeptidase